MRRTNVFRKAVILSMLGAPLFAADPLADFYDGQLKGVEGDVMGLAGAMPAAKFNFAPTSGEFKGVRTFAQQAKHIATIIYMLAGAGLNQKPPVDIGADDNGPAAVQTKEQILDYLKGAFAFAHKNIATLTQKNQLDNVKSPFGGGTVPRLMTASFVTAHSFDHYGQMVVYARMNGIVPPSSLPPPAPAKK